MAKLSNTIADRVIAKCGGVPATAKLVGSSENWVYRWRLSKADGGTGGLVPRSAQEAILDASRQGLCSVEPADFFDLSQAAE